MKIYNRFSLTAGFLLTLAFVLIITSNIPLVIIGFSLGFIAVKLLHHWEKQGKIHIDE